MPTVVKESVVEEKKPAARLISIEQLLDQIPISLISAIKTISNFVAQQKLYRGEKGGGASMNSSNTDNSTAE